MTAKSKHTRWVFFLTVATLTTLPLALAAGAQEREAQAPPQNYDTAAMEEAWHATMAPGEPHRWLEKMVGDWIYESSMWMNPEAPPIKNSGEARKSMVMEGRYLQEDMSGEMMGRPFTGRGITGFDNVTKKVTGSWIDNMSTGLTTTQGEIDMENHRIVVHGEMMEPASRNTIQLKMVTSVVDHDHHTFEYFVVLPNGHEMKQMEIRYTRKDNS